MEKYGLSSQQTSIWNLQQYYSGTSVSNLCGAIIYDESRDLDALKQAVLDVIAGNESLRLRFSGDQGIFQYLADCDMPIDYKAFRSEAELDLYASSLAQSPMKITDSQMCSFTVFSLEGKTGIIAKLNHLIADAWSFSLLADRLETAYESRTASAESYGYIQYVKKEAEYLNSDRYEKDRIFWQKQYADVPESTPLKITGFNSTAIRSADYIAGDRITRKIDHDLADGIAGYCNDHKISAAVLLESTVLIYLLRINPDHGKISIGVPVLNRGHVAEKKTSGMFISTIPLTVKADRTDTISSFIKKVADAQRAAFRHQRYPYEEIVKEVRRNHSFGGDLYDVLVSVQNAKIHGKTPFRTKWYPNGSCENPMVISFDQRDEQEGYTVTLDYQKKIFPNRNEVALFFERILTALKDIIYSTPDKPVHSIKILSEEERNLVINTFNKTYAGYDDEKCLHELFSEQAERTPDSVALIFGDRSFTFHELDSMSDALAGYLRKQGIGRNDIVPVIARRNWRIIAAMLGILKAGGAYLPVSPDYPEDRIRTMLSITECKIALCYGYDHAVSAKVIDLGNFDFEKDQPPLGNINEPDDKCYIIFTSGSTGTPKGCCITHSNFINTLYWRINAYGHEHKDIICISPVFTDTFGEDVFSSLISGYTLHFVEDNKDVSAIRRELQRSALQRNCLMTTPTYFSSIMSYITDARWLDVTLVGEKLPEDYIGKYRNHIKKLHNEYGPSECSVCASYKKIDLNGGDITIGRPIANTQIYILDERQNPLPVGVAGELCISGRGVGSGYLNQPELTAKKFIPNGFSTPENRHGKRLYRTGDLARWRIDGDIEYLGRIDTQVKIRGLRIELSEIENVMAETTGIELVAAASHTVKTGRQILVGYYTSSREVDERELRLRLTRKLPQYMVPNYFMRLERMPLTGSGKTDRKNLPLPDLCDNDRIYVAPNTDIEIRLCRVMADVFSIDRVGIMDNFFEMGGDSLAAMNFAAKAHEAGIEVGLQSIYDHPTIQDLAEYLEKQEKKVIRWPVDFISKETINSFHRLLDESIVDRRFIPEKNALGNIFLTGSTGFLGAHILDALLKNGNSVVYCLIRADSKAKAQERICNTLQWYFGDIYAGEFGKRIIPVPGDIADEKLSECLPENVQTIIHAAACVKHYGKYDLFHKVNVQGTRNVIKYAKRVHAIFIYISTMSVSGFSLLEQNTSDRAKEFSETDYYIGQSLGNVYIRSKFEAEGVVLNAIREGAVTAKIVRIGNLTNRTGDFRFQPNYQTNAFLKRIKAFEDLGLFPEYLLPFFTEFSPVDLTAEGILRIAEYADTQIVFHLFNPNMIKNEALIRVLNQEGMSIKIVSRESFHRAVENTLQDSSRMNIYEAMKMAMGDNNELITDKNIRPVNNITTWFLSKTGFQWNNINKEYLKGYISYFREAGYFNA